MPPATLYLWTLRRYTNAILLLLLLLQLLLLVHFLQFIASSLFIEIITDRLQLIGVIDVKSSKRPSRTTQQCRLH